MKVIEPTVFCILILGALSMTQTDALARGRAHHHGAIPEARDIASHREDSSDAASRDKDNPIAVYAYPEEAEGSYKSEEALHSRTVTSPSSTTGIKSFNGVTTVDLGSEGVGLEGKEVQGRVTKEDVVPRHPESDEQQQDKSKKQVSCISEPGDCNK